MATPLWLTEPQEHDFPVALDYLTLLFELPVANKTVQALRKVTTISKKAQDILRASGLAALGHALLGGHPAKVLPRAWGKYRYCAAGRRER